MASALLALAAILLIQAAQGFPTLSDAAGDNDNLMRLVEVRDLLAGQGWFDLHQYRMGFEGGFLMHWSRLVDAPIAAIILFFRSFGASAAFAETAAALVWPSLLFVAAMVVLLRCVRRHGDEWAIFPAAVLGASTLFFTNMFAPGDFDHHNLQIVLTLTMLSGLLAPRSTMRSGAVAGVAAASMLAVGMETAPYVACGGIAAALGFLVLGERERRRAAGFAIAFAATAFAALTVTVPPGSWSVVQCDAFSGAQFAAAAVSGLGLAAIALVPAANRTAGRRTLGLGVLGGALAVLALTAFPECLSSPYAGLPERLTRYWLNSISEAQSVLGIVRHAPGMFAGYYIAPIVGLAVLIATRLRHRPRRADIVMTGMLAIAVLVSFWQVRGAMFALALAVIPLSAWVGGLRRRAEVRPSTPVDAKMAGAKMIAAWLVSAALVWQLGSTGVAAAFSGSGFPASADAAGAAETCYSADDYARLAALPTGTVLVASNIGAPVLSFTPHRTFAGPYHRDIAGMLFALDAFMAPPDQAAVMARRRGVDYVAICPGNADSRMLAEWAPEGLMAALMSGRVPKWLASVDVGSGRALEIYRLAPDP